MRLKVFGTVVTAVALIGAVGAVGAASATNVSSHAASARTTAATHTTPTKLEPAASLTGDNAGTCALLRSGRIDCWGDNDLGGLGDGTVTSVWYTDVPTPVKGLVGAARLVTDGVTYCAVLRSGRVDCWGDNTYGSLGDGSGKSFRARNTRVLVPERIELEKLALVPGRREGKWVIYQHDGCARIHSRAAQRYDGADDREHHPERHPEDESRQRTCSECAPHPDLTIGRSPPRRVIGAL